MSCPLFGHLINIPLWLGIQSAFSVDDFIHYSLAVEFRISDCQFHVVVVVAPRDDSIPSKLSKSGDFFSLEFHSTLSWNWMDGWMDGRWVWLKLKCFELRVAGESEIVVEESNQTRGCSGGQPRSMRDPLQPSIRLVFHWIEGGDWAHPQHPYHQLPSPLAPLYISTMLLFNSAHYASAHAHALFLTRLTQLLVEWTNPIDYLNEPTEIAIFLIVQSSNNKQQVDSNTRINVPGQFHYE